MYFIIYLNHFDITESLCVNHSETHAGLHRKLQLCKLYLTLRAVIEMSTLGSNSLSFWITWHLITL